MLSNKEEDYLKRLHEVNQMSRDKVILALASGGLTFSLSVFDRLGNPILPYLLVTAWFLFAASLILNIFSFCFAAELSNSILSLRKATESTEKEKLYKKIGSCEMMSKILNRFVIITLILAILFLIMFFKYNFYQKDCNMSDNKKLIKEGVTPVDVSIPKKPKKPKRK